MRHIEQALEMAPGCLEKKNNHREGRIYFRMLCFLRCFDKKFAGRLSTAAFIKAVQGALSEAGNYFFFNKINALATCK